MPTWMTRTLALAAVTALPLALGPAAWAQTDSDPAEPEAEAEAETGAEPDADPEAPPASQPMQPKRVKVPESSTTTEEAAESEEAAETDEPEAQAETEQAAEPEAESAPEAGTEQAETDGGDEETGTGPFVGDYTLGDADAPVQVIEYASFTCPHCAAFHVGAWDELKEEFIDSGQIGFTMREVYFDRFGLWASMAARCGGEKAFYPLADQYLSKQDEWTRAEDPAQAIAAIARRSGLSTDQLKACLENQDYAKMLVDTYKENQEVDEVTSTPTFLILGPTGTERVVGNKPDELREAIESALAAG